MRGVPYLLLLAGVSSLATAHLPWSAATNRFSPNQTTSKTGDCGIVALALVCQADGRPRDLPELRTLTGSTPQGTTLLNLKTAATSLGYSAAGVRLPFDDLLAHVSTPQRFAILHLRPNHFLAVLGAPPPTAVARVRVAGLGQPPSEVGEDELRRLGWDGVALLLTTPVKPSLLRITPSRIGLGQVPIGTEKAIAATLHNPTAGEVALGTLRSDCGCVDVKVDRPVLKAGETAELSGRFRAGDQPGQIRKRITLALARPPDQVVEVELTGQVVRTIVTEPEMVTLQPNFVAGTTDSATARIRNDGPAPIKLTLPPLPAGVSAALDREELKPGESARLQLSADATFVTAEYPEINIGTTHPQERMIHFAVKVQPNPPLHVIPRELRFGVVSKEELRAKSPLKVVLSGPALEELRIAAVEGPAYLRPELHPTRSGKGQEIRLHVMDHQAGLGLTGSVSIKLECVRTGRSCAVKVPVSGILRNAD